MQDPYLPPGISQEMIDGREEVEEISDEEWARQRLVVQNERARRLQVITDLGLDITNPYNRLFVNGR